MSDDDYDEQEKKTIGIWKLNIILMKNKLFDAALVQERNDFIVWLDITDELYLAMKKDLIKFMMLLLWWTYCKYEDYTIRKIADLIHVSMKILWKLV